MWGERSWTTTVRITYYLPTLVTRSSAIAITTHWLAVLSGWIVQVTVMLYSSLVTLGLMVVTAVLVTEEAIGHK